MRISGGIAKGRKIYTKKAFFKKGIDGALRPTSAKVKEAIFNILRSRIINAVFLDLYAGTGAVGIEALSRGAERVVFVDNNLQRAKIIKEYVEKFGFCDRSMIVKKDALIFLKKSEEIFDIIFVDPPYVSKELELAISLIDEKGALKYDGFVIAEHSSKRAMPLVVRNLKLTKTYKYGDTSLSIYVAKCCNATTSS